MIARACAVPRDALLCAYVDRAGTYTDCFEVMLPGEAGLHDFIEAFYTTWLFRLERAVLSIALRRRVRDHEVTALANAQADSFAVWTVEGREPTQILLRDLSGGTRSYLAVAGKQGGVTRLLFGSAVVGRAGQDFPVWLRATMPLHRFYAKCLLRLAERKLRWC
jgi:hypothetical protein